MSEEDLTKPLDTDEVRQLVAAQEEGGASQEGGSAAPSSDEPASRSQALTEPVSAALVDDAQASVQGDAIQPTPVFFASDAESTGHIVLPVGLGAPQAPWPAAAPEADPQDVAAFLGAFFQELVRCGVKDFVVSPGSRSTGLAMVALEMAGDVYMDVDERGAAFFALGLAKATGNPTAVICTSGTAPANWLPAVLEAQESRVPLLLLSADRPPRLQGMAAHQTCDQQKLFGNHVKLFYQMPLPAADEATLAYARQVALDAVIAAHGSMPGARSCDGGPVHVNFPFEEPLKPASVASVRERLDALAAGRDLPPTVVPGQVLLANDAAGLLGVIAGKRALALCGEGSANGPEEAAAIVSFARECKLALLADPLSGLRTIDDPCVIDNYDTVLRGEHELVPEVIVRFGRWPVSKCAGTVLGSCGAVQLVVDMRDTRDAHTATTTFVRTSPVAFARSVEAVSVQKGVQADPSYLDAWISANDEARARIAQVGMLVDMDEFEGAYVDALFDLVPEASLVFSASSMSIRAIDTFYRKGTAPIDLLCNRGLSGIDGTLSSAFGAAHAYRQTTVLVGDLAFLHDANALALQGEMRLREHRKTQERPSIVVVVLNNNGGAIFDMLPQRSEEDYFERLFLTPQRMNLRELAAAFEVPYRRCITVSSFRRAYKSQLGTAGISIVEVPVPLAGLRERYERFW